MFGTRSIFVNFALSYLTDTVWKTMYIGNNVILYSLSRSVLVSVCGGLAIASQYAEGYRHDR